MLAEMQMHRMARVDMTFTSVAPKAEDLFGQVGADR